MRQSKFTKVMALMLSLVMITSVFVGNTLSRYVTSVSSTDSARVAVWGINGDEVTMELFKTDYDLDGKKIAAANKNDDNTYDKIIAPGTGGQSVFSIINFESDTIPPEVAYDVKISLDDSQVDPKIVNNPSIQWKLDNNSWGTFDELKTSILSLSGDPGGLYTYAPGEFATAFKGDVEHKIYWQWALDGNNEIDTQMGNDALASDIGVKISVSITAQQSDGSSVGMLDGANQVININDLQPAVFRSAAPASELQEVKVNGETVDPSNYEVEEGSTIIKFVVDYLRTLLKGTYKIEIVSKNMTATAKFYVSEGPIVHNGIIPVGGTYYVGVQPNNNGAYPHKNYSGATVYNAGNKFPSVQTGDVYVYGDYEYRYNMRSNGARWLDGSDIGGWSVVYIGNSQEPGKILSVINGEELLDMTYTFAEKDIIVAPEIPYGVISMDGTFSFCEFLVNAPIIPDTVVNMNDTFSFCISLINAPIIPSSVISMDATFNSCEKLIEAPVIPSTVKWMNYTFEGCYSLVNAPVIPSSVIDITGIFNDCINLEGTIVINTDFDVDIWHYYDNALKGTKITWIAGSISDEMKQIIAEKSGIELINPDVHNGTIPTGGVYYQGDNNYGFKDYTDMTVYIAGQEFPEPQVGDRYVYDGFEYGYKMFANGYTWGTSDNVDDGWGVRYIGDSSVPGHVLTTINGKNIVNMGYAFNDNEVITAGSNIPSTVTDIEGIYWGCTNLTGEIEININPEWYGWAFASTVKPIILTGSSDLLDEIANEAVNENTNEPLGNVTVKR